MAQNITTTIEEDAAFLVRTMIRATQECVPKALAGGLAANEAANTITALTAAIAHLMQVFPATIAQR